MLLEKLVAKQKELASPKRKHLSDEEFAAMLGISRQMWSFTRRGIVPVGKVVLQGTLRAFPDLRGDVLLEPGGVEVALEFCQSAAPSPEFKENLLKMLRERVEAMVVAER